MGTDYYLFRDDTKTVFALGGGGRCFVETMPSGLVRVPKSVDEVRAHVFWAETEDMFGFDGCRRTEHESPALSAQGVAYLERLTQRLWSFMKDAPANSVWMEGDGGDNPGDQYRKGYSVTGCRYEPDPSRPETEYWSDPLAFEKKYELEARKDGR